jgi:hypothetical protein
MLLSSLCNFSLILQSAIYFLLLGTLVRRNNAYWNSHHQLDPVFDCECGVIHIIANSRCHQTTLCCEFNHFTNAVLHDFFKILIRFGLGLGIIGESFEGFCIIMI